MPVSLLRDTQLEFTRVQFVRKLSEAAFSLKAAVVDIPRADPSSAEEAPPATASPFVHLLEYSTPPTAAEVERDAITEVIVHSGHLFKIMVSLFPGDHPFPRLFMVSLLAVTCAWCPLCAVG